MNADPVQENNDLGHWNGNDSQDHSALQMEHVI